jgi:hypothetical protein
VGCCSRLGEVLGLPMAVAYGPFAELKLDNAVSLDFIDTEGEIHGQHHAFLVSESDFDLILGRLRDSGREWWADPSKGSTSRHQPRRRRPRPLLRGSRPALAGDHHPSVRQRPLTSRTRQMPPDDVAPAPPPAPRPFAGIRPDLSPRHVAASEACLDSDHIFGRAGLRGL